MSRPLSDLVDHGFLRSRRGNARGAIRRQLTYHLTEPGRLHLGKQGREASVPSGALPVPPNPFVGRREELAQLRTFARQPGSVTVVEGPPGMGKTALVSRHIRALKTGRVPFWFAVRESSSPRDLTIALAHTLSPMGAPQLAYYSQQARPPVAREVADLALRALGSRPLVAVVDDVQFASPDLRHFLVTLVETMLHDREDHWFVVGQDAAPVAWEKLAVNRVILGGLDRAAAHELTDRRGGLAERFEQVYQSSLGSPLLLQLAVTTPGVEASQGTLPAVVVGRFSEPEFRALLPIALSNEPLPLGWITSSANMPSNALNPLLLTGALQRVPGGRVEMLQVVRSAMLQRADPVEEREGHIALARFYGRSRRGDSVREQFLHLVAAAAFREATQLLGRREATLLSLGYSDHLRTALRRLAMAVPVGPARVRALRVEAAILNLHSQYAECVACLSQAVSEIGVDSRLAAECLLEMVEPQIRMNHIVEAERTLERATHAGPLPPRLQAAFLLNQSRVLESRGELDRAKGVCYSAFQLARKGRYADVALHSVANWCRLATFRGDQEAALRTIEEMLPEARRSGRMDIVFNLLMTRGRAYAELQKSDLAEADLKGIKAEAEALGYLGQLAYALSGLTAIAGEAGRWNDALAYARQASSLAERLGHDLTLAHSLALTCWVERHQGRLDEARTHGEASLAVLARLPPSDTSVIAHTYLAEVFVDLKEVGQAKLEYEEALRLARGLGTDWLRQVIEKELEETLGKAA